VLVDNPRLVNHYLTAFAPGGIGLGVTVNTVKAGVNNCVLKKTRRIPRSRSITASRWKPIEACARGSVRLCPVLLLGEQRSGGVTFPSIDVVRNELGERLPDAGRGGDVAGE
jgi:hypothetical protein